MVRAWRAIASLSLGNLISATFKKAGLIHEHHLLHIFGAQDSESSDDCTLTANEPSPRSTGEAADVGSASEVDKKNDIQGLAAKTEKEPH